MKPQVIAGVVHAHCSCCAEPRELLSHVQLGPTRMLCPQTGSTYLDRGDGLYQPDGLAIQPPVETPAADLLSDRPARTADKTRITLERATFA
jgi:hypothetical protein